MKTEKERLAALHVAKTIAEEVLKILTRGELGTLCGALAQSIAVAEKMLIPAGILEDVEDDMRLLRSFCEDDAAMHTLLETARQNLAQATRSPEVAQALNQEIAKTLRTPD